MHCQKKNQTQRTAVKRWLLLCFFCVCHIFSVNQIAAQGLSITGNIDAGNLSITGTIQGGTYSGSFNNGIIPIAALSASGAPSSATYLRGDNTWATISASGTVTSVSVASVNGISGSVATATTTPIITLSLGAISPTSINASGSITGTTIGGTLTTATQPNITSLAALNTVGTITTGVWSAATINADKGGTGISAYTTGDILYAGSNTSLAKLAGVATGNALISGGVGTAPSWGKIGLTTHVTGILPATNGGTGVNNGSNTLTLAGSLVTTGANSLTLATTGTTSVSLPVSGRLIGSADTATMLSPYSLKGVLDTIMIFTVAGSYTFNTPPNIKSIVVELVGGGGGGGGAANTAGNGGSGGGSGGYVMGRIVFPSASYGVTVGGGGTGGAQSNTATGNGSAGTASSFSGFTGNGGAGGIAGLNTIGSGRSGGSGGTATGGILNIDGGEGFFGQKFVNTAALGIGGKGGSNPLGNGGPSRNTSDGVGVGFTALGYGGGGGGGLQNAGGTGSDGVVIVYCYR